MHWHKTKIHMKSTMHLEKKSVGWDKCLPYSDDAGYVIYMHYTPQFFPINPLYSGNPLTGTLTNSEDPDVMQHNAAFHLSQHCLLLLKESLGTEINHNLENST